MNLFLELLEVTMQFWLHEDDPIEQLPHDRLLVLFVLLRYCAQFGLGFFVYGGLYTLCVSCVLPPRARESV